MLRRTISALCFYLLLGGLLAHAGQFLDAPQYTVGTNPQAVAVADFNGDGIPDLAVVNTSSNSVSILLGNGDGTFTAKACPNCTTGSSPAGIAVGNFGNGQMDLVVTNSSANTVSVFLGNGDGTFQTPVSLATGPAPQGVAVGDFNNDGNLDFVVTNSGTSGVGSDTVGVFLGNGSGGFAAQATYSVGNGPTSVVVADFNNDGYPDLAVANKSTGAVISVLLNKGSAAPGTFNSQNQYTVGGTPASITAGDFNGDGHIDLAVANQPISPSLQGTVSVLLNTGTNGAFGTAATYDIGSSPGVSSSPTSIATGVTTSSGSLDLVVTSGNDNAVSVLLNKADGSGTFNNEVRYGTGATPYSAAVATLIPGGKADVVVANSSAGSVSVLMGNGDGTLQSSADFDSGPQPNSVVVGDFNGDGVPDLAFADGDCASCTPNAISVVLGKGDGTFGAQNTFATGTGDTNTYALVAAQFRTSTSPLDIAAVNNKTNNVSILLGNGDGTFVEPAATYAVGSQPAAIAYGDFNQDGYPDLAIANYGSNTISVLLNKGDGSGTFLPAVNYNVGHGPYALARANFNADKYPDLVVVNETDKTVTILLNNADGTGTFSTTTTTYATGLSGSPSSVAVGYFDNSGNLSVAVGDSASTNVSILLGNGDGTFKAYSTVPTGLDAFSLVAADFTGSGIYDLAIAGQSKTGNTQNLVSLLLGNGTGGFSTPTLFPIGSQASTESQSIAFGDFNNDGALDLAVANGLSSDVSILLNTVGTNMSLASSAGNPSYGAPVTFTANIAPSVPGSGNLTGTVTFENGSTPIGSPVTVANGSAALTTSTLPVGSYMISAVYSGNFPSHTTTTPETVVQAGTTSALLSSATAVNLGQSVTFSATISPDTSGTPTGTVTFLDGTTSIGAGTLNGSGVATLTTSSLAAGTQSITASYGGDTNYIASVSAASPVMVTGPAFTLGASALSPASVTAGATSTSTITITPVGGLNPTTVSLACAITPSPSKAPTCSIGTIAANGTATLTVSTTAASTTAMAAHHSSFMYAMWFLMPAMVFGTMLLPKQKRGKLAMFAAILFISAGCMLQSACGGSSGSTSTGTTVAGTPSGAYSITVKGTATGAATQTAGPLTLTVQ